MDSGRSTQSGLCGVSRRWLALGAVCLVVGFWYWTSAVQSGSRIAAFSTSFGFIAGRSSVAHSEGGYLETCERAAADPVAFATFKTDAQYQRILEHLTYPQGVEYVGVINALLSAGGGGDDAAPALPPLPWHRMAENDHMGGATVYQFPGVPSGLAGVPVSPNTLRYAKVAIEMLRVFGWDKPAAAAAVAAAKTKSKAQRTKGQGSAVATRPVLSVPSELTIVEIGCGYGGQALVLSRMLPRVELNYHLIDLPPVIALIGRYLSAHAAATATASESAGGDADGSNDAHDNLQFQTVNALDGAAVAATPATSDLVISNYAFSECTEAVRDAYVRDVLCRARRGYITINHFLDEAARQALHQKLKDCGKTPESIEERPGTSHRNYILIWK